MEVLVQKELLLGSDSYVHDHNFEFPDGTTSVSNARDFRIGHIRVSQELLDGLLSAGLTPNVNVGLFVPGFGVLVGIQEPAPYKGIIQLKDTTQFLRSILGCESSSLGEVKIQLEVSKIVYQPLRHGRDPDPSLKISASTSQKSLVFTCCRREANRFEVTTIGGPNPDSWYNQWSCYLTQLAEWTMLLSVKLVLPPADPAVKVLLAVTRIMLNDQVLADTKVIAGNGAEIKFHRSVLSAHSPAFERMFHTKMKEATSGVLELPDMTEESVRALKEYLYVWKLKAPQENSLVCFELFEAGHKYGISTLEEATAKILMRMDEAGYSAAVALRLFLLVKDMELPHLKQKAVEILKLKRAELKSLDEYCDFFKEKNASVAMELMECLASPTNCCCNNSPTF